ncbi:zinc finger protein GLIS1-like isoform X1, partial [Clarias magur]
MDPRRCGRRDANFYTVDVIRVSRDPLAGRVSNLHSGSLNQSSYHGYHLRRVHTSESRTVRDEANVGRVSFCSEKDGGSELSAEECALLRCGLNLPALSGSPYNQRTQCEADARSSSFQQDLGYVVKQEESLAFKPSSDSSKFSLEADAAVASGLSAASAPYAFNNEHGSSPSPGVSRHSALSLNSGTLKRHCLSGRINAAARMSLCANGVVERLNPSPPACLLSSSSSSSTSSMSSSLCEDPASMHATASENLNLLLQPQRTFLKQEPLDDFSHSEDDLFQHQYHQQQQQQQQQLSCPPRTPMPPPYPLHQYGSGNGAQLHLQNQQEPLGAARGRGEDASVVYVDKQTCRWIDCSAAYEQQEELVRHIEKVHIDQRKGEDFTCFWAGCIRRYKPFNARYKLLIHMRLVIITIMLVAITVMLVLIKVTLVIITIMLAVIADMLGVILVMLVLITVILVGIGIMLVAITVMLVIITITIMFVIAVMLLVIYIMLVLIKVTLVTIMLAVIADILGVIFVMLVLITVILVVITIMLAVIADML